jgi:hypothetical protein
MLAFVMRFALLFISCGFLASLVITPMLRADEVEMQNGDHYSGKVLSVSTNTIELESDVLGKIHVPRDKVARLTFGDSAVASNGATSGVRVSASTNSPTADALTALTNASAIHKNGSNTVSIQEIREQMLAGSPEAAGKYDEMVNGLLDGSLGIDDIRRKAKSSEDEILELKRDLGPEAGDALDGYLQVLDQFLKESANEPTNAAPAPEPKSRDR